MQAIGSQSEGAADGGRTNTVTHIRRRTMFLVDDQVQGNMEMGGKLSEEEIGGQATDASSDDHDFHFSPPWKRRAATDVRCTTRKMKNDMQ